MTLPCHSELASDRNAAEGDRGVAPVNPEAIVTLKILSYEPGMLPVARGTSLSPLPPRVPLGGLPSRTARGLIFFNSNWL